MLTTEKLVKVFERLLEGLEWDIEDVFGEDVTVHEVAVRAATDKVLNFINENMVQVPRVEGTLTDIVSDSLKGLVHTPPADKIVPLVAKRRMCWLGDADCEYDGFIGNAHSIHYFVGQSLYLDEYGNFVVTDDVTYIVDDIHQTLRTVKDWNAKPSGVPTALYDVLDEDTRDVLSE